MYLYLRSRLRWRMILMEVVGWWVVDAGLRWIESMVAVTEGWGCVNWKWAYIELMIWGITLMLIVGCCYGFCWCCNGWCRWACCGCIPWRGGADSWCWWDSRLEAIFLGTWGPVADILDTCVITVCCTSSMQTSSPPLNRMASGWWSLQFLRDEKGRKRMLSYPTSVSAYCTEEHFPKVQSLE